MESSTTQNHKQNIKCFRCGEAGHIAAKCPTKRSEVPTTSSRKCFNCGKSGHLARDCRFKEVPAQSFTPKEAASGKALQIVDIGVNLTNYRFKTDLELIIKRAVDSGVYPMIITGTSVKASQEALKLSKTRKGVLYSTAGVHPHDASSCNTDTIKILRELASHTEVVAIGECGLDFNRMYSPKDVQEEWFEKQLELAAELKKPLFLHEREAHDSFVKILTKHRKNLGAAVVHCFTGNKREVEEYVKLNLHIGFTGVICNTPRGNHLREILSSKIIPLNKLMIETDAPFMFPHTCPVKTDRNEPAFLPYVLKVVAECYNTTEEEVAKAITRTSLEFFGLESK